MAAVADVVDVDEAAAADNGTCENMAEARLAASQNKQAAKMLMSLSVINFHITHTQTSKEGKREVTSEKSRERVGGSAREICKGKARMQTTFDAI